MEINGKNFSDVISQTHKTVVINFYADWCKSCQKISPVLEKLHKEHNEISLNNINVEKNCAIAQKYGIKHIPTMLVFRNGKLQNTIVGYTKYRKLLKGIEKD